MLFGFIIALKTQREWSAFVALVCNFCYYLILAAPFKVTFSRGIKSLSDLIVAEIEKRIC